MDKKIYVHLSANFTKFQSDFIQFIIKVSNSTYAHRNQRFELIISIYKHQLLYKYGKTPLVNTKVVFSDFFKFYNKYTIKFI